MAFSDRLKELRTKFNLSQSELARRLNVAKSTLAMYEIGKREPNFETAQRIADIFDVSIDYLIGRTNNPRESLKENDRVDVKKVLQKEKAHWGGYPIPEEEKKTIQRVLEAMIRREEEESATKES